MTRVSEIDWIRSMAMLSVVMIHASSTFVGSLVQPSLLGVTPALFCNQATRCAIPLFFLLSGLSLGLNRENVKLPGFWFDRLRRVGLPYLLWTLFYFFENRDFCICAESGLLRILGKDLLLGDAAPHLWFIFTLLQLYLLYPLLRRLMDRFPRLTLAIGLALSVVCTLIVVIPFSYQNWWRAQLWRLFPTWLGYFLLGMALTRERLNRLTAFCRKHVVSIVFLGMIAAVLYAWDSGRSGDLDSVKLQLFLYTPLCFLALCAVWELLRKLSGAAHIAAFLAMRSMGVYFLHIYVLKLLRRIDRLMAGVSGMLLLFAATFFVSLLLVCAAGQAAVWIRGRMNKTK